MQNASQAWLVLLITGSAERLGAVVAASFLPFLLFSLPAGVLADRFPKRRLMLYSQSLMLVLSLSLCVLIWRDWIRYEWLLIFAFLQGSAHALDLPARQSLVVELAGKARYASAISLNSFAFNLSRLIGPAIAGLVIAHIGLRWTYFANSLSFLPLLAVLLSLRLPDAAASPPSAAQQMREGLAYVWGSALIRQLILALAWVAIFGINFQTLIPAYARLVMGLEADGYGFLMAALGFGAIGGSLWQMRAAEARPARMTLGIAALGLLHLCLYLSLPVPLIMGLWALAGFAMVTTLITTNTTIQTLVPDQLRGRVMSVYSFILLGAGPLGAYLTGLLFEWIGGRQATALMGLLTLMGLYPLLRKPLPNRLQSGSAWA
jgi:MFS family permease